MNGGIWFISTGKFGALCLKNLADKIKFSRIITGQPTRSGRNNQQNISEVEKVAHELNLDDLIIRTGRLSENQELLNIFNAQKPDLIFVIDFGQIIREPFLSSPKFGCINIHPSLLPELRGAAPIQRALLQNFKFTGVSIFQLTSKMDAGKIFAQEKCFIPENFTAEDLYIHLSELGSNLAEKVVNKLPDCDFQIQDDDKATFAPKIEKHEHELNFRMSALEILNHVRALNMSGGAYVMLKNNKRLKILRARIHDISGEIGSVIKISDSNNPVIACGVDSVEFLEIQPEGKKILTGSQWINGAHIKTGDAI